MKTFKIRSLFALSMAMVLVVFSAFTTRFVADDPIDKIATAIQAGNARALAAYFDSSVEITIQNDQGVVYSKAQAEQVMKDFFSRHQPTSFKVMHKGSSGGSNMYGIGTLQTAKGSFRVNIFYKKGGADHVIYKMKFTND